MRRIPVLVIHGKMHSGKSSLSRGIRNSMLGWWHAEFKRPVVEAMHKIGFTATDLHEKVPEVRALMQKVGPALQTKDGAVILNGMLDQLDAALNNNAVGVVVDDLRRLQEFKWLQKIQDQDPGVCPYDVQLLKLVRLNYDPPSDQNPNDPIETDLDHIEDAEWDLVMRLQTSGDDPTMWQNLGASIVGQMFPQEPVS